MSLGRFGGGAAGLTTAGIWQRRWLSLAVLLTGTLAASAAAVGPVYSEAARTAIVRNAFTSAPVEAQGIMVVADRPYRTQPGFFEELAESTRIPAAFEPPIRGAGIKSGIVSQIGRVDLIWREGSCARIVLLSGRCPSAPGEVVASTGSRSRYGWEIGEQVLLNALVPPRPLGADAEKPVEPLPLAVVGIYEPSDREERYWFGIQDVPDSAETPDSGASLGRPNDPLITGESTLEWAAGADAPWTFSVTLLLDYQSIVGEDAEPLRTARDSVEEWAAGRADVFTTMKGVAAGAIREQESLAVSIVIVIFELVGLIYLLLFLAVSDLVRARRWEIGLARLRGQSRAQVWRFGLGEPVALLILALPIGVAASVPIVGLLSEPLLGPGIEVSIGWQGWIAASGGALGGLIAAALAARSTVTRAVTETLRGSSSDGETRTWVLDAVVIALVIVGLIDLTSGGLLTQPSDEGVTALLVPAILSIAVALIAARALPHIVRSLFKITDRRGGVGPFLGVRHAARSGDTAGMVVVLTVAFSLATFAVTAWAVTSRNHLHVATVHNGAPVVLVVTPPEGSRISELVDVADPGGQSAVPVAIYDRTARLLAVDTHRLPHVANWRSDFTDVPLVDLLPELRPPSAQPVMLSGDMIRVTVDTRRVTAPESEHLLDLELSDQVGPVRIPLDASGPVEQRVLEGRLPASCNRTCELRGVTIETSTHPDGGTSLAELVITRMELHSEVGWRNVDAGLATAGAWRAEGGSDRVPAVTAPTPNGLVVTFETGDLARAVVATHPPSLPAVTLGAIGPRPIGDEVGGLDGGLQEVETVAQARALPGAIGPTALVDYETAENAAFGLSNKLEHQVWVTEESAAAVEQSLRDQGALVIGERTVFDLRREFNGQGPGLALALLLVIAAAGAILAMARAGISLYAAGRERSYQFAALTAIGASKPAQRAALLVEQAIVVGAGALAGTAAGTAAAFVSLRRIPQFTTPPVTPALTYTPDLQVIAGTLAISAIAVAITVGLATEAIRRSTRLEQLREASP